MLPTLRNVRPQVAELGIGAKPADPNRQLWILSDIIVQARAAIKERGEVVFIARGPMGLPAQNIEFIVGWQNIVAYPNQDRSGRFCMKLDHVYDPAVEHGQYWGGFLEEGIAPDVIDFGIPKGYSFEIKIVYTRLEGGT